MYQIKQTNSNILLYRNQMHIRTLGKFKLSNHRLETSNCFCLCPIQRFWVDTSYVEYVNMIALNTSVVIFFRFSSHKIDSHSYSHTYKEEKRIQKFNPKTSFITTALHNPKPFERTFVKVMFVCSIASRLTRPNKTTAHTLNLVSCILSTATPKDPHANDDTSIKNVSLDTQILYSGIYPGKKKNSVILTPMHMSTTFVQESVDKYLKKGFSYSHKGNPTVTTLKEKVATIKNGYGVTMPLWRQGVIA